MTSSSIPLAARNSKLVGFYLYSTSPLNQHFMFKEIYSFTKCVTCLCFLLMQFLALQTRAQVTWPAGQLLPSFPATAPTQDFIYLQTNPPEEKYLFASLKGIVNMTQPRIFVYDGDAFAEG